MVMGKQVPKVIFTAIKRLQNYRCYLCCEHSDNFVLTGRTIEQEHVKPRSRSGAGFWNILMACNYCNTLKGSRLPYPCEKLFLDIINQKLYEEMEPHMTRNRKYSLVGKPKKTAI